MKRNKKRSKRSKKISGSFGTIDVATNGDTIPIHLRTWDISLDNTPPSTTYDISGDRRRQSIEVRSKK
jgi:hypothetical protein